MHALLLMAVMLGGCIAQAQTSFAVATIRPSAAEVKFESDGETKLLPASVQMRDVSIQSCIKWAYGVQRAQVLGRGLLTSEKYDIEAKADGPATEDEMKAHHRDGRHGAKNEQSR